MAVLKVINTKGKYRDDESFESVIGYILNPQKTRGCYLGSWAISDCAQAALEMEILSRAMHKDDGVKLRHFAIGFDPEKVSPHEPETAFLLARDIALYYGDNYQIVYAVHTDKEYLHVHFVMNAVSYTTGKKYQGKKEDLYSFMNHCRCVFKKHGIREYLVLEKMK